MDWNIHEMERAAADAAVNLGRRPLWVPGIEPFRTVYIRGGNKIDGQDGIKTITDLLTSLPAAYDPASNPSCADGIGYGDLYVNGIYSAAVIVINDQRSSFDCFLLAGDNVFATPVTLSTGSGNMIVYSAG
jgi:hypothetical protein